VFAHEPSSAGGRKRLWTELFVKPGPSPYPMFGWVFKKGGPACQPLAHEKERVKRENHQNRQQTVIEVIEGQNAAFGFVFPASFVTGSAYDDVFAGLGADNLLVAVYRSTPKGRKQGK
jgi:hypothetical protein